MYWEKDLNEILESRPKQRSLISLREVLLAVWESLKASGVEDQSAVGKSQRRRIKLLKDMCQDVGSNSLLILQPTSTHIDTIFVLRDMCIILSAICAMSKAHVSNASRLMTDSKTRLKQNIQQMTETEKASVESRAKLVQAELLNDQLKDQLKNLGRRSGLELAKQREVEHIEVISRMRRDLTNLTDASKRRDTLQQVSTLAIDTENESLRSQNQDLNSQVKALQTGIQQELVEKTAILKDKQELVAEIERLRVEKERLQVEMDIKSDDLGATREQTLKEKNIVSKLENQLRSERTSHHLEVSRLKEELRKEKAKARDEARIYEEMKSNTIHTSRLNLGVHKRLDKMIKEKAALNARFGEVKGGRDKALADNKQLLLEITRLKGLNKNMHTVLTKTKQKHQGSTQALIKQLREEILNREREILRLKHDHLRAVRWGAEDRREREGQTKLRDKEIKAKLKMEDKVVSLNFDSRGIVLVIVIIIVVLFSPVHRVIVFLMILGLEEKLKVAERTKAEINKQTILSNSYLNKEHNELRRQQVDLKAQRLKMESDYEEKLRELKQEKELFKHQKLIFDDQKQAAENYTKQQRKELIDSRAEMEKRSRDLRRKELDASIGEPKKQFESMSDFNLLQAFKDHLSDLKTISNTMSEDTKFLINLDDLSDLMGHLNRVQSFRHAIPQSSMIRENDGIGFGNFDTSDNDRGGGGGQADDQMHLNLDTDKIDEIIRSSQDVYGSYPVMCFLFFIKKLGEEMKRLCVGAREYKDLMETPP
eukprot:jgi/Bigna1/85559/estExt_fgenesh1_pg.C_40379